MRLFHIHKITFFVINILIFSILVSLSSINATVDVVSEAASDTAETIVLNNDGLTLDSLYSVVFDDKVSYEKKTDLLNKSKIIEHPKMEAILKRLLQEAKKTKDADKLLSEYTRVATYYYYENQHEEKINNYLDSAANFVEKAKDDELLGNFYYLKGRHILYDEKHTERAYSLYDKAIPYYEKTGEWTNISRMLNDIATDAYNNEDTAALHIVRDRLKNIATRFPDNKLVQYDYANVVYSWYLFRFEQDKQPSDLDSALSFGRRTIELDRQLGIYNLAIYQDFALFLADNRPDGWHAEMDSLLAKCREVIERQDTVMFYIIQQQICEGAIYTLSDKLPEAEQKLSHAEELLKNYNDQAEKTLFADLYYWFTKLYEAKGDYKNALLYNEKKNEMQLSLRDGKISNMLARFDIQNKDMEIERQKVELVRRRRNNWIIGLSLAAAVILCFMWGYMTYRKAKETKARLIAEKAQLLAEQNQLKAEQEKLKVENELQEERAANAELEKYEILSDFHLKELELNSRELELSGKNEKLEELQSVKATLDEQVRTFAEKIAEYEAKEKERDRKTPIARNYTENIKRDLKEMIKCMIKPSDDKGLWKLYIEALNRVDDGYVDYLKAHYTGALTLQYIKYCIALGTGMSCQNFADVFNIDIDSAYKIRYRLKKNLNLASDESLDLFLSRHSE